MRSVTFEPFECDCAPADTIESFDDKDLPESVLPRPQTPPADNTAILQKNLKRLADAGADDRRGDGCGQYPHAARSVAPPRVRPDGGSGAYADADSRVGDVQWRAPHGPRGRRSHRGRHARGLSDPGRGPARGHP